MNHSIKPIIFQTILFTVMSSSLSVVMASSLPSGDEISQHINARNDGVQVSRTLTMELIDRRGKTRVRETQGFRKYFGNEKRTVIHYLKPRNVKGTAFLTYDYPEANRDDDQWLYLPALRKVRRISASDRGDYFLGTDFTYEDIKKENKVSIDDYRRETLREEMLDGFRSYVVESIPVNDKTAKELGYSKVLQWVDADIWIVRKSKFWDIQGNLLKTTNIKDIRQIQGIWTVHRMEVVNHKTSHKTNFTFSNVNYETEVSDDSFTERSLRRGL